MDGIMGRAADRAGIQFRLLNRRKGPAVQGPRTQADRKLYRAAIQELLRQYESLSIIQGEVASLIVRSNQVSGVILADGTTIPARAVIITAGTFFFFGHLIASWFTDAPAVVALSSILLGIVGVFQIVDGLQVASASMLRGMHDTKVSAVLGFIAYWLVGIPLAAYLGNAQRFGSVGIWWGLAGGLLVACVGLGWRLQNRLHTILAVEKK
jgi:hypothetical protein